MGKKTAFIIVIALFLLGLGVYFMQAQQRPLSPQAVTNFEECAQAGFPVGESFPRQCWTPDGRHFVEEIKQEGPPPVSESIMISGTITCLPKISSGPQTMECAIGLKDNNGDYYGLKNLFSFDLEYKFSQPGLRVQVSGVLLEEEMRGPDGNRYDIIGVIDLASIKEAEN